MDFIKSVGACFIAERVCSCTASFDLYKISRRKDWAKQADIQKILTIITSSHHPDSNADSCFGGLVPFEKCRVSTKVVVLEINRI